MDNRRSYKDYNPDVIISADYRIYFYYHCIMYDVPQMYNLNNDRDTRCRVGLVFSPAVRGGIKLQIQ